MDVFLDAATIFENKIVSLNVELMEGITSYMEACSDDIYINEAEADSLIVKTKKFFAKIVASFQSFISTIQVELDRKVRKESFDLRLRKLHKELNEQKGKGIKEVEVCDVWTMRNKYLECTAELQKYAKKFPSVKYKNTSEVDADIAAFNKTMEKYKKELEQLADKTIVVSLQKMLNFIDDEVSGSGKIMSSLNDAVTLLQQMQKDCELLEKKRDMLGPDVIPKHVGFLKRIAMSICGFFKKWVVKFITTMAFIIG